MSTTCQVCRRDVEPEGYGRDRSKPDGRNVRCKTCERNRKRHERSTPEGKRRNVEAVRRHRAKRAADLAAQSQP